MIPFANGLANVGHSFFIAILGLPSENHEKGRNSDTETEAQKSGLNGNVPTADANFISRGQKRQALHGNAKHYSSVSFNSSILWSE